MHISKQRYWLALHPDVKGPIGGVKQMHRLAEALMRYGREATIIQDSTNFHPGWFVTKFKQLALKIGLDVVILLLSAIWSCFLRRLCLCLIDMHLLFQK